jgi:hypothetical protein
MWIRGRAANPDDLYNKATWASQAGKNRMARACSHVQKNESRCVNLRFAQRDRVGVRAPARAAYVSA